MAKAGGDQFSNLAYLSVTESAANTLTFKKLETGVPLFEKIAWIIHRIDYWVNALAAYLDTNGDNIYTGLSTSNQFTTVGVDQACILDVFQMIRTDYGTAATGNIWIRPVVRDFSGLPGGGLIVPPNPLYLFVVGAGCAAANFVMVRLRYSTLQLTADQYWELVEGTRIIAS